MTTVRPSLGSHAALVAIALLLLLPGFTNINSLPSTKLRILGTSVPPSAGPTIQVAPSFVPDSSTVSLGRLSNSTSVSVTVGLALRDPAGLQAIATLISTPGTSEYRQYLSPKAIAESFGPTESSYAKAEQFFTDRGLSVSPSPDHTLLLVQGPANTVGNAFGTTFVGYREGTKYFYSHPTAATLPRGLPWAGVIGVGTESAPRPLAVQLARPFASQPAAGCPTAIGFVPCQIATAYNFSALLAAGTNGTGVRIGVVDTYDSSENQTTLQGDLTSFLQTNGIPLGTVNYLYPVPTSRNLNRTASSQWGLEEALDLEWSRASAPGATIDMTLAPDASAGLYASVDWLVAHHAVDVISLSWGEPDLGAYNTFSTPCSVACNASSDGSYTLLHPVLLAAAAEGISVLSASGDCGAAEGTKRVSTSFPASDPMVTGVGGTVLSLGTGGAYGSEVAWSGNQTGATSPGCQNQGGSGGGFSPYPKPSWQSAPGFGAANHSRGVPDVSLDAGSSFSIVYGNQSTFVGGTSASTPVWAGIAAIADQFAGVHLGFLNPSLYAIARSPSYHAAFHDIRSGWNGYFARPGWDPVTGLGSPNVSALLPQLSGGIVGPAPFAVQLLASPRYAYTGTTVNFSASAVGGATPYRLVDIDFGDGNATLAPSGRASHSYANAGVYIARAVVFDNGSNSSVSGPVLMVAGGGSGLLVTLSPSTSTPGIGSPVTFNVTVQGGVAPYRFSYLYGDGSYWMNGSVPTASRAYGAQGAYCAFAVVSDSASPVNGDISAGVPIGVGGVAPGGCPSSPVLSAQVSSPILAADEPGDFPLAVSTTGGTGAITTRYLSDNLYTRLCSCGIFKQDYGTIGPHTIIAYANDSLHESARATINVTVYAPLLTTFNLSSQYGTAPLVVTATALASGGHLANASATIWSWGDGTQSVAAVVNHTYSTAGEYFVTGLLSDQGHGNSSEAFLVEVVASGVTTLPLGLVAHVLPALNTLAGYPVQFVANPTGGTAPYSVRWEFGQNDSAFGVGASQTFSGGGCLSAGTCPLLVNVTVRDAVGHTLNLTFPLRPFLSVRWSSLSISDHLSGTGGRTPYLLNGTETVSGVPGIRILWSWGDGNGSLGPSASHVYLTPGNYTVTETTKDAGADILIRSHTVVITGATIIAPSALGGPRQSVGLAPAQMVFAVNGTGGAGGPFQYNWSFGDGALGSGNIVAHLYTTAGHYLANLTVTDAIGAPGLVSYPVFIYHATNVTLNATVAVGSSTLGSVVLKESPECDPTSVPGCSPGAVRVNASWTTGPGSHPWRNLSIGVVTFSSTGEKQLNFSFPPGPTKYSLAFAVVGPNYTGADFVLVDYSPNPGNSAGGSAGHGADAHLRTMEILLGAVVIGAVAAALAVIVGRRRRASP